MVQPVISIMLHRSYVLDILLIVVHTTAALCVASSPIPETIRDISFIIILLSLAKSLLRKGFSHLVLEGTTQQLRLTRSDSALFKGAICRENAISSIFAVVNWQAEGHVSTFRTLLLPDQMTKEDFRRIRVWLRWGIMKNERPCV